MIDIARSRVALWVAFALVHAWITYVNTTQPHLAAGDVIVVYRTWIEQGEKLGLWPGIDTPWVYPIGALAPMALVNLLHPSLHGAAWMLLVTLLDAIAFAVLISRRDEERPDYRAGWWWIAFLALLGPIALVRIDSITVPFAVVALLVALSRPALAGALLAVAAWMKVWPGAIAAAAVVALPGRLRVLGGALVATAVIVATALVLGSGSNVWSFLTVQGDRGLQIEAPVATWWMWRSLLTGQQGVHYDPSVLTFQIAGPGVEVAASLLTPLLVVGTVAVLALGISAIRRGARDVAVLPVLALAVVSVMLLTNKVGSPQLATWIIAPIVAGLVAHAHAEGIRFRVPAAIGLVVAVLTQWIYPYWYDRLLALDPLVLSALTLRNLLYLALLVWSLWALRELARRGAEEESTPPPVEPEGFHEIITGED